MILENNFLKHAEAAYVTQEVACLFMFQRRDSQLQSFRQKLVIKYEQENIENLCE